MVLTRAQRAAEAPPDPEAALQQELADARARIAELEDDLLLAGQAYEAEKESSYLRFEAECWMADQAREADLAGKEERMAAIEAALDRNAEHERTIDELTARLQQEQSLSAERAQELTDLRQRAPPSERHYEDLRDRFDRTVEAYTQLGRELVEVREESAKSREESDRAWEVLSRAVIERDAAEPATRARVEELEAALAENDAKWQANLDAQTDAVEKRMRAEVERAAAQLQETDTALQHTTAELERARGAVHETLNTVANLRAEHQRELERERDAHNREVQKLAHQLDLTTPSVPAPPPIPAQVLTVRVVRVAVFYCAANGVVRDFHIVNPTPEDVEKGLRAACAGVQGASFVNAVVARGVSVFESAMSENTTMTVASSPVFSCNVRGVTSAG